MSDIDVVDLTPADPTPPRPTRRPAEQWQARQFQGRDRVIGALILALLAVGGLRVHAVRAPTAVPPPRTTTAGPALDPDSPRPAVTPIPAAVPVPSGPPASSTGAAPLAGTGARLLLLGTTLTTYDVTSGKTSRPFGADTDGTVVGAAPLTDGDVVIESVGFASGRAYGIEGARRHDLGFATSVTPGAAMDTAWLTDTPETQGPNRVRLVNLAGSVLAGPYAIPSTWRLERASPGGLLIAIGDSQAPYALHLWTPGSTSPGPLLGARVINDASGGGEVLTVDADGGVAANGTPTTLPGDARAYAVSGDGSTLAALSAQSLTVQSRGPAVSAAGRTIDLPAGSSATALAFAPSGWLFVSLGTRIVALAPGSSALQAVPAVFTDATSDLLVGAAIGTSANPRVGR